MSTSCAICFESFETEGIKQVVLPCCHVETSSTQFCFRCIEILCQQQQSSDPERGKCPRCTGHIQINTSEQTVQIASAPSVPTGRCGMCRQNKELSHRGRYCSACAIGMANRLRYECDRCHGVQVIPHPMYRYQPDEGSFGGPTWACHGRCGDYTHWRIVADDVERVPEDDIPEGWVLREREMERNFESVRQIRREESGGRRAENNTRRGRRSMWGRMWGR